MDDGSAQEAALRSEPRETCDACGFDSELYDGADTVSSQRIVPAVLAAAAEGLDDATAGTRPDPATWSIAEYVDHVREVVFGNRMAIEMAVNEPGIDLGHPQETGITAERKPIALEDCLEGVTNEYRQMEELLRGLADQQWQASVTLEGTEHQVGWFARHVLHDGLHHLGDIGRIRHRLGYGARTQLGAVDAVHVSNGGVPKLPVPSAAITARGVEGDAQADRRHHGRPVQAISLWSTEVIEALQAEGHPIGPGQAGENITVGGIDWADLRPGSRLDVGDVRLLVSAHAIPCAKNAQWFSDRDFNRILHGRHPGSSRLYAIPLNEGTLSVGDVVSVEPAPPIGDDR